MGYTAVLGKGLYYDRLQDKRGQVMAPLAQKLLDRTSIEEEMHTNGRTHKELPCKVGVLGGLNDAGRLHNCNHIVHAESLHQGLL